MAKVYTVTIEAKVGKLKREVGRFRNYDKAVEVGFDHKLCDTEDQFDIYLEVRKARYLKGRKNEELRRIQNRGN